MSIVDPLQELGRKMRTLAVELGCDMTEFHIEPDLDGDTHRVCATFVLPELVEDESTSIGEQAEAFLANLDDNSEQ